jgi:hypothetical protein
LTSPLCPVTVLHLSGHCHCVFCGRRQGRGPHVPCPRGRGMAPHSPCHCTVRPSFLGTLVGSRFLPSSRYQATPSHFFSRQCVARTPLCRANLVPSFSLFPPLNLARERILAMLFTTSCPAGDPPSRCLHSRCAPPPPPSTGL